MLTYLLIDKWIIYLMMIIAKAIFQRSECIVLVAMKLITFSWWNSGTEWLNSLSDNQSARVKSSYIFIHSKHIH